MRRLVIRSGTLAVLVAFLGGVLMVSLGSVPQATAQAGAAHEVRVASVPRPGEDGAAAQFASLSAPSRGPAAFVVEGLTGVVAVASLSSDNLALRGDGTVREWQTYRQTAANGDPLTHSALTQIDGVHDVIAVARGAAHRLALRADGTVWAWGENFAGQLGDGTWERRAEPTPVAGLTDVVAVAAGGVHSLALHADGAVDFWGHGTTGAQTDDRLSPQPSPTRILGLPPIAAITAASRYSVAVDTTGGVWAWDHGSLSGEYYPPLQATGPARVAGLDGVSAVVAGRSRHLAVKADGTVWTWSPDGREAPAPLAGLANVVKVADGENHQAALAADGTIWTWGPLWTDGGQRAAVTAARVVQIMGPGGMVGLAAGDGYTLAVDAQGDVVSLAATEPTSGQVALGTTALRLPPPPE